MWSPLTSQNESAVLEALRLHADKAPYMSQSVHRLISDYENHAAERDGSATETASRQAHSVPPDEPLAVIEFFPVLAILEAVRKAAAQVFPRVEQLMRAAIDFLVRRKSQYTSAAVWNGLYFALLASKDFPLPQAGFDPQTLLRTTGISTMQALYSRGQDESANTIAVPTGAHTFLGAVMRTVPLIGGYKVSECYEVDKGRKAQQQQKPKSADQQGGAAPAPQAPGKKNNHPAPNAAPPAAPAAAKTTLYVPPAKSVQPVPSAPQAAIPSPAAPAPVVGGGDGPRETAQAASPVPAKAARRGAVAPRTRWSVNATILARAHPPDALRAVAAVVRQCSAVQSADPVDSVDQSQAATLRIRFAPGATDDDRAAVCKAIHDTYPETDDVVLDPFEEGAPQRPPNVDRSEFATIANPPPRAPRQPLRPGRPQRDLHRRRVALPFDRVPPTQEPERRPDRFPAIPAAHPHDQRGGEGEDNRGDEGPRRGRGHPPAGPLLRLLDSAQGAPGCGPRLSPPVIRRPEAA